MNWITVVSIVILGLLIFRFIYYGIFWFDSHSLIQKKSRLSDRFLNGNLTTPGS
jgi:hypothetical protein